MVNVFVERDELTWEETTTGAYTSVFNSRTPTLEKLDVCVRSLNPGMSWQALPAGPERILVVESGELEVSINGEAHAAPARTLILFAAKDVNAIKNVGRTPARVYVSTFYTEATSNPEYRTAVADASSSKVIRWSDTTPQFPAATTAVPWFKERRDFLAPTKTLTSPRLNAHATVIEPGSPSSHQGAHQDVTLFFMFEGMFEFGVEGETHVSGPGSFVYLEEGADHDQIPVGAANVAYLVVHIWSRKSELNTAKLSR